MKLRNLFRRRKKVVKVSKPVKVKKQAPPKVKNKRKKKATVKESTIEINKNECPECGSLNVVISQITGNTICQDCGAILAGLPADVEKQFANVKKKV